VENGKEAGLPVLDITRSTGNDFTGRVWYESYMSNRAMHLEYAANADTFTPRTGSRNATYAGDKGCIIRFPGESPLLKPHRDTFYYQLGSRVEEFTGGFLQTKVSPVKTKGDVILAGWAANSASYYWDIGGDFELLSGSLWNDDGIASGTTNTISGNVVLNAGAIFNVNEGKYIIGGSWTNRGAIVGGYEI